MVGCYDIHLFLTTYGVGVSSNGVHLVVCWYLLSILILFFWIKVFDRITLILATASDWFGVEAKCSKGNADSVVANTVVRKVAVVALVVRRLMPIPGQEMSCKWSKHQFSILVGMSGSLYTDNLPCSVPFHSLLADVGIRFRGSGQCLPACSSVMSRRHLSAPPFCAYFVHVAALAMLFGL